MKVYKLNNSMQVEITETAENQCRTKGHQVYNVSVDIWTGSTLDKQGFVIDNHKLQECMRQGMGVANSCELMAQSIVDYLTLACGYAHVQLHGYRVSIRPIGGYSEITLYEYLLPILL